MDSRNWPSHVDAEATTADVRRMIDAGTDVLVMRPGPFKGRRGTVRWCSTGDDGPMVWLVFEDGTGALLGTGDVNRV